MTHRDFGRLPWQPQAMILPVWFANQVCVPLQSSVPPLPECSSLILEVLVYVCQSHEFVLRTCRLTTRFKYLTLPNGSRAGISHRSTCFWVGWNIGKRKWVRYFWRVEGTKSSPLIPSRSNSMLDWMISARRIHARFMDVDAPLYKFVSSVLLIVDSRPNQNQLISRYLASGPQDMQRCPQQVQARVCFTIWVSITNLISLSDRLQLEKQPKGYHYLRHWNGSEKCSSKQPYVGRWHILYVCKTIVCFSKVRKISFNNHTSAFLSAFDFHCTRFLSKAIFRKTFFLRHSTKYTFSILHCNIFLNYIGGGS